MNVKKLIIEGEGVRLDFKKTITSFEKIAKTMVAFANNQGGRLLIGVEDRGAIIGVKSEEEEKFMIRTAAGDYCHPPLSPRFEEVDVDNKVVLVAEIGESGTKPHYALGEDKKWWVYVRINDKSVLASKIVVEVLKKAGKEEELLVEFSENEQQLLEYLHRHERITLHDYCKLVKMNRKKASRVLVKLLLMGVIRANGLERPETYSIA